MDAAAGSPLADWQTRALTGGIGGAARVSTIGQNLDVDTGTIPEDITSCAELGVLNGTDHRLVQLPSVAVNMSLYCANVNDTAAGTGLRTVSVTYLDAARASKTVTLNCAGNTEVPLPEPALRINVLRGLTCGTFGGSNLGLVHIRDAGGLGKTYALIQTGVGFARSSLYSVPALTTLDAYEIVVSVNRATAASGWVLWSLCLQTSAGFFSNPLILTAPTGQPYKHELGGAPIFSAAAGMDVWIRALDVSNDNSNVTAGFIGASRLGPVN